MRVVAMFRVSTDRQAEQGASLDAQQRRFHELAATNSWHVLAEFRGSESATRAGTEREVLQNVLACIREQRPHMLYVHEQSRLTRGDDLEVALLLRELKEQNIKVCVNGAVRDLASIDERFMFGIQSLVDRTEAERIRERVIRGKREKARQGKRTCGIAPFGYSNPPPGDPRRGILQIIPEHAAIVRRIFEMAASGVGPELITQMLNLEGAASPRGKGWRAITVCYVLRNVEYIGTHATGIWSRIPASKAWKRNLSNPRAIVVENAHEPIISKELWDRVHDGIPNPRTRDPRLLTGFLYMNGGKARGESDRHGPAYVVLHRPGMPRFLASDLEPVIWQAISQVLSNPKIIEACIRQAAESTDQQDAEARVRSMEAKLGKVRSRNQRLLELRIDNEISREEFARQSETLRTEATELEAAIAKLKTEVRHFDPDATRRALEAARVALAPAERLDPKAQRRLLRGILHRVDLQAERNELPSQDRGENGRYVCGRRHPWRIVRIELTFAGGRGQPIKISVAPAESPSNGKRARRWEKLVEQAAGVKARERHGR